MPSKQLIAAVVGTGALVLAVVAVGAVALRDDTPAPVSATARQDAMVTSFPDLEAPSGDPELAGLASAAPEPGAVVQVPGPFDDRFRFEHLALTGRGVTGEVLVTSDVSGLIDLQVQAGFYDEQGRLLGADRYTYHLDESHEHGEGGHDVHQDFRIAVPKALRDETASAAVGVTVLVNE